MSDPLAGKRERINAGELEAVTWPDRGKGAPIVEGQEFTLRSCRIIFRAPQRVQSKGKWLWRAEFVRIDERVWFMSRRGVVTTKNPAQIQREAVRLQDNSPGNTLNVIAPEDESDEHRNYGEAPEQELPPPYEVPHYAKSREAHQRYLREMEERRRAHEEQPLEVRIAAVRRAAEEEGIDVRRQFASIEQRVKAAESKIRRLAGSPSSLAA